MIINTVKNILDQLNSLLQKLSNEEYALQTEVLRGKSIGIHVRHIVEFFGCLIKQYESGVINYDERERNILIENSREIAIEQLNIVIELINSFKNKEMKLFINYLGDNNSEIIDTNFQRELVFNIEHTIHHLAIIRIIIENDFKHISLPDEFGYAFSTLQYQKEQCVL